MALPSSGPLSLLDIANEIQVTNQNVSLDNLGSLAGFSKPVAVSDFYGFSACSCVEVFCDPFFGNCQIEFIACGDSKPTTVNMRGGETVFVCSQTPTVTVNFGGVLQGPGTECKDC